MKMSQYIMEQEINGANIDDIELTRCFAEMCVLGAMLEVDEKCDMICEYATDASDFEIVMEAKGKYSKKKNKGAAEEPEVVKPNAIDGDPVKPEQGPGKFSKAFGAVKGATGKAGNFVSDNAKGAGATVKKWWKAFVAWLKKLMETIRRMFMKMNLKQCIKMLEDMNRKAIHPNEGIEVDITLLQSTHAIFRVSADLFNTVQDGLRQVGEDGAEVVDVCEAVGVITAKAKAIPTTQFKKPTEDEWKTRKTSITYNQMITILTQINDDVYRDNTNDAVKQALGEDCPFTPASIAEIKKCAAVINNKYAELPLAKMVSWTKSLIQQRQLNDAKA